MVLGKPEEVHAETRQLTDTDCCGRKVAIIFIGGDNLNAWMLVTGWPVTYRTCSSDYVSVKG